MGENVVLSLELNPLKCNKCDKELSTPIRLPCQHCFCLSCIQGHKECLTCSLNITEIPLQPDPILIYLLESSKEQTEQCANCDRSENVMFFCETCQQPLCDECRVLTHQAKIFSSHHILPLEESGRLRGQLQCKEHKSPFVLFCSESKNLMCIECFNNSSVEKRNHFLSIEVAHKNCQERLNESVKLLKNFQNELKEQIEVRKSAQEQVSMSSQAIQREIEEQCEIMMSKIRSVKDRVIDQIKMTEQDRAGQILKQIKTLINIEAPIKLNLLSASVFCSYASQLDLLHSFSSLLENIKIILAQKMENIPSDGFGNVNYVDQFVKAVETELDFPQCSNNSQNIQSNMNQLSLQLFNNNDIEDDNDSNKSSYASYAFKNMVMRDHSYAGIEYGQTTFGEQIQRIEIPLKDFVNERNVISNKLLEIQQDITKRRCLVDKKMIESLINNCEALKTRVTGHLQLVDEVESILQDLWMEQFDSLRRQNAIFQQKKEEYTSLQKFSQKILDTVLKVRTVSSFLASVISVVDDRRCGPTTIPPMEQICMQILTLSPDSKQRCEAIEKEEENRRLAKEKEKQESVDEVKQLPKALKETPRKGRPVSMMMIENSRDRPMLPVMMKKKKRAKHNSQSDESSGIRSPSPKDFCSSATSLDTVSLNTIGISSTPSVSPIGRQKQDVSLLPDDFLLNDDLSEVTKAPSVASEGPRRTVGIKTQGSQLDSDKNAGKTTENMKESTSCTSPNLPTASVNASTESNSVAASSGVISSSANPTCPSPITKPPTSPRTLISPPPSPVVKPKPTVRSVPPIPPPSPRSVDLDSQPSTPKTSRTFSYGVSMGNNAPSEGTLKAREMLLQSIKERVKRID
ncbi:unnamed protein product [Bursaphelenchus okinawaensis]|uniref:RING finger protein 207 n=1 Tax=Bursaphelenchus okinawaensis TaxID=465554 RepID=A0A811LA39_9BILA|nr:unnamed protein product [Bursaphelenchus okinawaensis]CAG9120550.1 unnamed protein product [Bursaphelenchus okinawaensis]